MSTEQVFVEDISRIVKEVKKQAAGPLKLKKAEGNTQRKGKSSQETIVVSFQFISSVRSSSVYDAVSG